MKKTVKKINKLDVSLKDYPTVKLHYIFECVNNDITKWIETVSGSRLDREKLIKWDEKNVDTCFDKVEEFCKANKVDIKLIINNVINYIELQDKERQAKSLKNKAPEQVVETPEKEVKEIIIKTVE
jgi:hypothetical protein